MQTKTLIMNKALVTLLMPLVALSCGDKRSAEDEIAGQCVGKFAEAYFNYNLPEALKYCTADSRKWIRFAASNISDSELDTLRARTDRAKVEIMEIKRDGNNNGGTAVVKVSDFMSYGEIGRPHTIVPQAWCELAFVVEDGKCLVRMEGLPQNGMSGRAPGSDE